MTRDEVLELIQRDLDGDLAPAEQAGLRQALYANAEYQLLYNRLKRVSDQLEQLPKVTPPYSLVDAILPRLAQEPTRATPAQAEQKPHQLLPHLERKKADQTAPVRRAMPIWLAKAGSGLVAACLLIGLVFTASQPRQTVTPDPSQHGSAPPSSLETVSPGSMQGAGATPTDSTPLPQHAGDPSQQQSADAHSSPAQPGSTAGQEAETPQGGSTPAFDGGKERNQQTVSPGTNPKGAGPASGNGGKAALSERDQTDSSSGKSNSNGNQKGKQGNGKGNGSDEDERNGKAGGKPGNADGNKEKKKSDDEDDDRDDDGEDDSEADDVPVNVEELIPSIISE